MTIIEEIKWNAELKGELRGIEIGMQRGIQRGIEIGIQRAAQRAEEVAIKGMLDHKIAVEMIAKWLETTVEHVEAVQQRIINS